MQPLANGGPAYAKFGLALAGGGIRGAAHVGILKAFLEEGMIPGSIAGTSAGGIVAGLYASGMGIGEMEDWVRYLTKRGRSYLDPDCKHLLGFIPQILLKRPPQLRGLIKGNRLQKLLCYMTDGIDLEQVRVRMVIPAVDLRSGCTVCYTNCLDTRAVAGVRWERTGKLCQIMMASASVPAVFHPRYMDDYCLVDGGVTYNLPSDLLVAAGEPLVIAVDLGLGYEMPRQDSVLEIASHSFSIMSERLKECSSQQELMLLNPSLPKEAGLLNFEAMTECMNIGYQYGKTMAQKVKRVLKERYNVFDYGDQSKGRKVKI